MRHARRPAIGTRAVVVALVLFAHLLLVLPFLLGGAPAPRASAPALHFVSLWLPEPVPEPRPASVPDVPPAAAPVRAARETPRMPPPADTDPARTDDERARTPATSTAVTPVIDWNAALARAVERGTEAPSEPATFSASPETLREPCVPREFDDTTRQLMVERLPTGPDPDGVGPDPTMGCLMVGGRPMCVQKIGIPLGSSEADGTLFTRARAAGRPESSVPSVRLCD